MIKCTLCGKAYKMRLNDLTKERLYYPTCKCNTDGPKKLKPLDEAFIKLDELLKKRGKK